MTITDFMASRSPNPAYEALVADTSDAWVLAVNLESAADPTGYLVADEGISEQTATLDAQTVDTEYVHSGKRSVKVGTTRQFALKGDSFSGNDFQDAILDHAMKYGVGNAIIRDYVWFNSLTGKGEKGKISIVVTEDGGGAAGANSTFSATLNAQGVPEEYTYAVARTAKAKAD